MVQKRTRKLATFSLDKETREILERMTKQTLVPKSRIVEKAIKRLRKEFEW